MKTVTWNVASNLFLTAIRGSYINAKKMSNFYRAKLSANNSDPDIAQLENNFTSFDTTMDDTYSSFISQGGNQSGASETFSQKLGEITANVNLWDSSAQLIYAKGTGQYLALFPNGHTAFLQGSQIDRITAVKALSLSLGTVAANDTVNAAALTTLQGKVDIYYIALKAAYDDKNDGKNISSIQSDVCYDASVAVCEQMYIGMGTLMIKYYKTPEVIGGYFDEATIRGHQQTDFTHLVKPAHVFTIAQRTLAATDQIRINNTGNVPLRFYTGNTKDTAIGITFIEVAPGANNDYAASLLGDVANNHFITVYNPDGIQTGSFVLDLL
jgi:hypothetical protein